MFENIAKDGSYPYNKSSRSTYYQYSGQVTLVKRTSSGRVVTILFIITLVAFGLADILNSFLAQALEAPSSISKPADAPPPLPEVVDIDEVVRVILEGNLFPQPEQLESAAIRDGDSLLGYEVSSSGEVVTPDGSLSLRLMGTVVGPPRLTYAIIDAGDEGQRLYHLHDMVLDVAKVVRISRNEVTVDVGGMPALLRTEFEPVRSKPTVQPGMPTGASISLRGTKATAVTPRKPKRKKGKQRFTVDRKEVDAAFANLPRLLTQARVMPHYSGGKMAGFRVVSVKSDSLFDHIGLQPQDVLKRINGMEIKDPSRFLSAFQQVKEEETITLDLVRKGQPSTFVYDIR
ncbi:MAG TPA: PDZ domain-containing protein [Nitrospirales bacterium]|nr:PDZ domain-containing protein [Nitrospirales bacterium]